LPPFAVIGCADHQEVAREIAERSITLVKNEGQVPLRVGPEQTIAVITPIPVNLTPADTSAQVQIRLGELVQQRHARTRALQIPFYASGAEIAAVVEAASQAEVVIVGTINATQDPGQIELVRALYQRGKKPVVVALRTPYDLSVFPMVGTYLCSYGIRSITIQALVRVLFGEIEAHGILPCAIPGATTGVV
jgi:beta-N-acetylhexosaminidase